MITIFSCGRAKPPPCSECGKPSTQYCGFPLHGKKQGQLCARSLCERCGKPQINAKTFRVTDDHLDAPDGAIVDGFRRSGEQWIPLKVCLPHHELQRRAADPNRLIAK